MVYMCVKLHSYILTQGQQREIERERMNNVVEGRLSKIEEREFISIEFEKLVSDFYRVHRLSALHSDIRIPDVLTALWNRLRDFSETHPEYKDRVERLPKYHLMLKMPVDVIKRD